MNQFKSSAELKASAREHLLGHYGTVIGAFVLMGAILGVVTIVVSLIVDISTIPGTILYYAIMFLVSVLTGLFTSGSAYLYLKLICGRPVSVADLFYGFQLCPYKAVAMQAWITLITYIGSLPQIVVNYLMMMNLNQAVKLMLPYALSLILSGVVTVMLSLLYSQAFFLLHDFPQYTAKELLRKSRRLMVHHKGRLFYLYVSFLPLMLLGLLSWGLALLWVIPYIAATEAEFFLDLIKHNTEAA